MIPAGSTATELTTSYTFVAFVCSHAVAVLLHAACTRSTADCKGEQHAQHCRAYVSRSAQPHDANAAQRLPLIHLYNLSAAGSEEVILPDFGEGFGNSDGMLLGGSPLS